MAQLCLPSCWLPVWYSCLLSRQPPTQVLMTVSRSPDRQRGYLPEPCHHLKQQTSSNQQDCRCAVSGQLMLSASCLLRCSGDWEHAQSQSPSVAGVKRQLLGASEPWKSPELRGQETPSWIGLWKARAGFARAERAACLPLLISPASISQPSIRKRRPWDPSGLSKQTFLAGFLTAWWLHAPCVSFCDASCRLCTRPTDVGWCFVLPEALIQLNTSRLNKMLLHSTGAVMPASYITFSP
jgi:hypothetical protein